VYDEAKPKPSPKMIEAFEPFDDFNLVPNDKESLLDRIDRTITLDVKMVNLDDGANYAAFNDITYVSPKVPTLYSVLSTGANSTNPVIYGSNTNSFVLGNNEIVEVVINNDDPGKHPFHLHGHAFQVVTRSEADAGFFVPGNVTALPTTPMKRDTVLVRPNGHVVLRFRADNPGVWIFHCKRVDLMYTPGYRTLTKFRSHRVACRVRSVSLWTIRRGTSLTSAQA
jgi:iron transport multicopper oxidase